MTGKVCLEYVIRIGRNLSFLTVCHHKIHAELSFPDRSTVRGDGNEEP